MNTPLNDRSLDLYNFIKIHLLTIFPFHDYSFDQDDIERKIFDLRKKENTHDDTLEDVRNALKQLDRDGILLSYKNTISRDTGENYL